MSPHAQKLSLAVLILSRKPDPLHRRSQNQSECTLSCPTRLSIWILKRVRLGEQNSRDKVPYNQIHSRILTLFKLHQPAPNPQMSFQLLLSPMDRYLHLIVPARINNLRSLQLHLVLLIHQALAYTLIHYPQDSIWNTSTSRKIRSGRRMYHTPTHKYLVSQEYQIVIP